MPTHRRKEIVTTRAPVRREPQARAPVSRRRSVAATILWFGSGKLVPGLVTLASVPVWLALFGPANYALYSMLWAASLIGNSLATGWLRQAIFRHTGSHESAYERLPRRWRRIVECSVVLAVVPVAAVAVAVPDATERWVFIVVAGAVLVGTARYSVLQTLLQRDGDSRTFAVAESLRALSALAVTLVLAAAGLRTAWSIPAAQLVALTGPWLLVARRQRADDMAELSKHRATQVLREHWTFGWPLSLWLALSGCLAYADRFVLSSVFGAERAGQYAAAADLAVRGAGLVIAPVIMFLHPELMRAWNSRPREATVRLWRRSTGAVAAGCAAYVAVGAAAYDWLGRGAADAPVPLLTFVIILVGAGAWQLALVAHKPLEAAGRSRTMLVLLAGCSVGTVALDLALVGRWGEMGVAAAFASGALAYVSVALLASRTAITSAPAPSGTQT